MMPEKITKTTTTALDLAKERLYCTDAFCFSNLIWEKESKIYEACSYNLNGLQVLSRKSKITAKKNGQFVTLWKRIGNEAIQPFDENEAIDLVVVHVCQDKHFGQFVFPKSVLIKQAVFASEKKKGKLAMRVYPPWDVANSKQAQRTQQWQLDYFLALDGENPDPFQIKKLYFKN